MEANGYRKNRPVPSSHGERNARFLSASLRRRPRAVKARGSAGSSVVEVRAREPRNHLHYWLWAMSVSIWLAASANAPARSVFLPDSYWYPTSCRVSW